MKAVLAVPILAVWMLWSPAPARADPFVFTTALTTSGWFDCRSSIVCSGEGTNSITFGGGDTFATLTFTGVDTTVPITSRPARVMLGAFELTASDGFTFPPHPANPRLPVIDFRLTVAHPSPVPASRTRRWLLGPGARPELTVQRGDSFVTFPIDSAPFGYTRAVYTFRPFPLTIRPNAITPFTADVAAVPEPASMLLLGTGLAGLAAVRRRKRRHADV